MEEQQSIQTEPEQKPKPKKKISFWKKVLALIPILFISTWALAMWNPSDTTQSQSSNLIKISGYDFYQLTDGTFGTYITATDKKIPIAFRLDPRNASSINLDDGVVQKVLTSAKIYLTLDPNQSDLGKFAVAAAEISRITGLYSLQTVAAYTKDSNPISPNVPLRTCQDATNQTAVILLETAEKDTGIYLDRNCIRVQGKTPDDIILAADKLGMNLLGIKL